MTKYRELTAGQVAGPRISKEQLGGWETLAQAYRELQPSLSYNGFRARVLSGKSVIEAGTIARSNRGRPVLKG
jgi:hypothetical protein